MKYIVFLFAVLFISLSSCDDFVDIDPKGVIIPSTVEHYRGLLNNAKTTGESAISYEIACDDIYFKESRINSLESWQFNAYAWNDYYFNPEEIDFMWQQTYKEIADCNIIINGIDDAEGDQIEKNYVKGEAHTFRALSYFLLVNMYGKSYDKNTFSNDLAVPLLLEAQVLQQKPRATVETIYTQILDDLEAAEKLLSDSEKQKTTSPNAVKFHADLTTVYALKMRVNLFMQNYKGVITYGEKFFKRWPVEQAIMDYNTLASPVYLVPLFNPEHFYFQLPSGSYDFLQEAYLSDDLLSTFDKTKDLRLTFLAVPDGDKYQFNNFSNNLFPNPGFTTGEVLLTLAEAYVRNHEKNKALGLINQLRQRRYNAAMYVPIELDKTNEKQSLTIVLNERRKELMYHGKRFMDLKRLNKNPETAITFHRTINGVKKTIEPNDLRYQLAIPRDVKAMNPLLEQNPR